jgi:dUTP pyrophosphatase
VNVLADDVTTITFRRLGHAQGLPVPARQSAEAAGLDLSAATPEDAPITLAPGERALIPTGFAVELPAGFEGQVRPRSGLAHKYGITVLNAPGTVDSDYRGEIGVLLVNLSKKPFVISRGERIAQLVVTRFEPVEIVEREELSGTSRGEKGFGSTGR